MMLCNMTVTPAWGELANQHNTDQHQWQEINPRLYSRYVFPLDYLSWYYWVSHLSSERPSNQN